MGKSLTSVSEIVRALGGTKEACAIFDVGQSAIGNWRGANRLPPHTYPIVQSELMKRGLSADLSVWRWDRTTRKADPEKKTNASPAG